MKTNATRCDLCHAMVEVSGNISEKAVHATFLLNEKGRDITITVFRGRLYLAAFLCVLGKKCIHGSEHTAASTVCII